MSQRPIRIEAENHFTTFASSEDVKGTEPKVSDDEEHIGIPAMATSSSNENRKRPHGRTESKEESAKVSRVDTGLCWNEEEHRAFVAAIYDVGMKHASPAVILENMRTRPTSITSERVKSHLQKYRLNRGKGKEEFLSGYDSWMTKALGLANKSEAGTNKMVPPEFIFDMMSSTLPIPWDLAAYLSYSVLTENRTSTDTEKDGNNSKAKEQSRPLVEAHDDYLKHFTGAPITFPRLSEKEKKSTLGKGMCYVMALFVNMTEHLSKLRGEVLDQDSEGANSNGHICFPEDSSSSSEGSGALVPQRQAPSAPRSPHDRALPIMSPRGHLPEAPYYQRHQHAESPGQHHHRDAVASPLLPGFGPHLPLRRSPPLAPPPQSPHDSFVPPRHQASPYYSHQHHYHQSGDYHRPNTLPPHGFNTERPPQYLPLSFAPPPPLYVNGPQFQVPCVPDQPQTDLYVQKHPVSGTVEGMPPIHKTYNSDPR